MIKSVYDSNKTIMSITITEYKLYRKEGYDTIKRQDAVITSTLTLCVAIFTLGYYFLNAQKNEYYTFFMGLLGPSAICFVGSYWLNLVFQQKRYNMYLRELEVVIKKGYPQAKYEWERYLNGVHQYKKGGKTIFFYKTRDKTIFFRTKSVFGHKITLAMYMLVPLFMYVTAYIDKLSISHNEWFNEWFQYIWSSDFLRAISIILAFVYVMFVFAIYKYVKLIIRMQEYTESLGSTPILVGNKYDKSIVE